MVSQALMPKRCNVLLETVKELPPLQVLEKNGDGLCHGLPVKAQNLMWGYGLHQPASSLGGKYGTSRISV
jgi:hypothetical protein